MSSRASISLFICGLLILGIGGLTVLKILSNSDDSSPKVAEVRMTKETGTPRVGGPFTLTDHQGQRRSPADFKGKFMLVYFGYAFCPDICPMALSHISEALENMGSKASQFQPLFITLDPERDTVEALRQYVTNYHPSLIALTGNLDEIAQAAKAYRVYWKKVEEDESSTDYLMDHSSIVYVMDRQGRFVTSFNHATPPEKIKEILLNLR